MAYIGKSPIIGNFVKLDAITAVNGQAAYTMQNGGANFTDYETVNQFLVSLNGTIQAPTDSFTGSGSTLTFASNLSTGDVIDFIMVFGNSLSAGVPTDDTVTAAKLNDDIISGQTALATEPAETDEFLVSDAGTLKRIDYSLIKASPGLNLLQTTTISDAATVTIGSSSIFSSTHKLYMIVGTNIHVATDGAQGRAYFQQGGSDVTSNYARTRIKMESDANTVGGDNNNYNAGSMDNIFGNDIGNASGEVANFISYLYEPASTDNFKQMMTFSQYFDNSANGGMYWNSHSYKTNTNAIDGIKLFASSGNISSGTVKIYGLA